MAAEQSVQQNLKVLIRNCSLTKLKSLSQIENVRMMDVGQEPRVFAHWMSFALLSGKKLRVVFKAHFMTESAKYFASKIYGKSEKVRSNQAADFFKEFCGLTVGQLKVELSKNNVKVGISLPGLIRGFDEVFYKRAKGGVHDSWELHSGEWKIYCSTEIELFENFALGDTDVNPSDAEGDVEYL